MDWTKLELHFEAAFAGELFCAHWDGEQVMGCAYQDGEVDFWLRFDFLGRPPLHLRGPAAPGARIRARILPHRLELYVDGTLADEEWPCADHFLARSQLRDNGCGLRLEPAREETEQEPVTLGRFRNAQGWRPEENVFVGDCMPFSDGGRYHVLYLKDRHHHQSKWGLGAHQWSHISSQDLVNWEIHPMAVAIDDPAEGSICTGSWMLHEGVHYLFYTVRTCDGSPAPIRRSVSRDGYHFQKDPDFHFVLSEKYTGVSARDPKLVRAADGSFHMFLTTSLTAGPGCLAHLVSEDLDTWRELPEPIYAAPPDMWEPECSDYFYLDGFYYLVFSLRGRGYYLYSREPFSGWQEPEDPIIPCKTVPKAAIWRGRLIFAGFSGIDGYAGTLTFTEARVRPDGQLEFLPESPV